jgi:nucleoside-diphosphate-sugar epimerase
MKVVITGNASGIGKSLTEAFSEAGHSVLGYDIKENKDICDQIVVDELINDCYDADVFVNNALTNQVNILQQISPIMKDKLIVNISSAITYYYTNETIPPDLYKYFEHKKELDILSSNLSNVMNVRPAWVDTTFVEHVDVPKMKPEHLAELILFHVNNRKKYQVIDIVVK